MSMESAIAFYERLEKDEELKNHIKELGTPEKIEPYVRNVLGFNYTKEEMQKVVYERNPEMSDEELESITGGSFGALVFIFLMWAAGAGACQPPGRPDRRSPSASRVQASGSK